ncbi:MAG TPA: DNA polymerase III subunit gamma/tau, partial [Halomonas sp.]|nr:DNA polymerase III subunit gamma/tau [Halomonas sp.]
APVLAEPAAKKPEPAHAADEAEPPEPAVQAAPPSEAPEALEPQYDAPPPWSLEEVESAATLSPEPEPEP